MDKQELVQEFMNFLEETGNYHNFLDWAEQRGFDREELDNDIERALEI